MGSEEKGEIQSCSLIGVRPDIRKPLHAIAFIYEKWTDTQAAMSSLLPLRRHGIATHQNGGE